MLDILAFFLLILLGAGVWWLTAYPHPSLRLRGTEWLVLVVLTCLAFGTAAETALRGGRLPFIW